MILSNLEYEGFGFLKCVRIHPSDYFSIKILEVSWS